MFERILCVFLLFNFQPIACNHPVRLRNTVGLFYMHLVKNADYEGNDLLNLYSNSAFIIFDQWTKETFDGVPETIFIFDDCADDFNTTEVISQLQNYGNWRYQTDLFLIFKEAPDDLNIYHQMLREFVAVGMFNVAVMVNRLGCVSAHPFEPPEHQITYIKKVTHSKDCFPEKTRNLNGHEFTILTYDIPMISSTRSGKLLGVYRHLYQDLTKYLNATFITEPIEASCIGLSFHKMSPTKHLVASKLAFNNASNSEKFEYIPGHEFYNVGVIVPSNRIEDPLRLISAYFNSGPIIMLIIAMQIILFNWCVLKRKRLSIFSFNGTIPSILSQGSSDFGRNYERRGSRLLITGIIMSNFMFAQFIQCIFTAKLVQFIPDRTINSFDDIVRENYDVYVDGSMACVFELGNYGLAARFQAKQKVTNESLWTKTAIQRPRAVFFREMRLETRFLESGSNRNAYNHEKYYKLPKLLVSIPILCVLPVNSPFTGYLEKLNAAYVEGGFFEFHLTNEVVEDELEEFRYFASQVQHVKPLPLTWKEVRFGFVVLGVGLILSLMVFVVEVLWGMRERYEEEQNIYPFVL